MVGTEPDPNQWRILCERLADGTCVPFLGAAANVSGNGYEGLPLADEVALHLVGKLINTPVPSFRAVARVRPRHSALRAYRDLTRLGAQDLARVALLLSEDEDDLFRALAEKLPEDSCEPSPLLDLLARMPGLKLIITTNYDHLMERALDNHGREYKVVVQPKKGFELDEHTRLSEELLDWDGLVLYKLHGSFSDRKAIIVTEEDYIEFLTVAGSKERGVPGEIQGMLKDSVLLFLGYGLQDWDFRTIYKALIEKLGRHKTRRSFAIQFEPSPFWFRFWLAKGVEIFDSDLYAFVAQLEREYARLNLELLPPRRDGDA
jgi:SIR2-like domain